MSSYNNLLLDLQYHIAKKIQFEANNADFLRDKIDSADSASMRNYWIQESQRHIGRIQALKSVYADLGEFIENPDALEEHGNF